MKMKYFNMYGLDNIQKFRELEGIFFLFLFLCGPYASKHLRHKLYRNSSTCVCACIFMFVC